MTYPTNAAWHQPTVTKRTHVNGSGRRYTTARWDWACTCGATSAKNPHPFRSKNDALLAFHHHRMPRVPLPPHTMHTLGVPGVWGVAGGYTYTCSCAYRPREVFSSPQRVQQSHSRHVAASHLRLYDMLYADLADPDVHDLMTAAAEDPENEGLL